MSCTAQSKREKGGSVAQKYGTLPISIVIVNGRWMFKLHYIFANSVAPFAMRFLIDCIRASSGL